MDFLGEKLNSSTGEALSTVNEIERRRKKKSQNEVQIEDRQQANFADHNLGVSRLNYELKPLSDGIPFGADTFAQTRQPPQIGFRVDLLDPAGTSNQHLATSQQQPETLYRHPNGASDQSLYEGDAWTRLWFQRVMILTIIRLLVFIRKIYEDFQATKTYGNRSGQTGHFLVSAITLFLPTIVFTFYRVNRYLQSALASTRSTQIPKPLIRQSSSRHIPIEAIKNDEDSKLTKALMSTSFSTPTHQLEDDGLVTARQTPTNLEDYHDSTSQQNQTLAIAIEGPASPAPSTALVKDSPDQIKRAEYNHETFDEKVDLDKMGIRQDRDTIRVVIGASEQILHGVLFVFWQLKRQVDVVGYLVERSCLWRKPREEEKEELGRLRTGSDGLEWFQDFYAAFLAILVQVYTLGLHLTTDDQVSIKNQTLNSAVNMLTGENKESSNNLVTKVIGHTLAQSEASGKDILIMSQLVVSLAVVISLLIAVKRRDDGPLNYGLSMLGWGSIFASRIIIIALGFVHLDWRLMLSLVILHILGITAWIYKMSINSFNDVKSEIEDIGLNGGCEQEPDDQEAAKGAEMAKDVQETTPVTNQWSLLEHLVLLAQIFTLFAVPSLFYWPIMFNLKLHSRPFKYLILILSENFLLIPAVWYSISSSATPGQWYLLIGVGASSIAGFIFVSLYIACKPRLTEYFARADELFNAAEQSGIYFEFCSRIFKMPELELKSFTRLMNQTEQEEEEET